MLVKVSTKYKNLKSKPQRSLEIRKKTVKYPNIFFSIILPQLLHESVKKRFYNFRVLRGDKGRFVETSDAEQWLCRWRNQAVTESDGKEERRQQQNERLQKRRRQPNQRPKTAKVVSVAQSGRREIDNRGERRRGRERMKKGFL